MIAESDAREARNGPGFECDLAPEDQLVFIHIPKTAGLTVRSILANRFHLDARYPVSDEWWLVPVEKAAVLDRYRLFSGHFPFCVGERLRRPVFVTMLRDPVRRIVSHFEYLRRVPATPLQRHVVESGMPFEEFVTNPVTANGVRDWQAGFVASIPLADLVTNHRLLESIERERRDPGRSLYPNLGVELAKQRLRSFAAFGLCERFDESIMLFDYTFGWKPSRDYQSFNVRPGRGGDAGLSSRALDAARALSRDDLELYEFASRLFEERFAAMVEDLLGRHGKARHARMAGGPDTATILDLLDDHFRHRRRSSGAPPAPAWVWDPGAPVAGHGWHAAERLASGQTVRWGGPGTESSIEIELRGGTGYRIEAQILHVLDRALLDSVSLKVDGNSVEVVRSGGSSAKRGVLHAVIPASLVGDASRFVTIEWKVARTVVPAEFDRSNADPRKLGLLFEGMRVVPCAG